MSENVTQLTQEEEQEIRALDEIRERTADMGTRRLNPGLVAWLGQRERLFASNVRGDLQNAPERHPDVQLLKRLLPQSSISLHIRMAWLCWRARQVRFFHPDCGSRLHVGADVLTWPEALESADERDSIHDEAFAARTTYYNNRPSREEAREKANAEEEAVALSLMHLPTTGRGPAVDIVPTTPPTVGDGKALQQQEISAAKEQERTEEKQLKNLRQGKPVNAGVKVRKNQNQK